MSFSNADTSFSNELGRLPVFVSAPSTGTTVVLTSDVRRYYVNNSGTLAALTIQLPAISSRDQMISIAARSAVTSLTIKDSNGTTVSGVAGALAANTPTEMIALVVTPGAAPAWKRWS